MIPWTRGHQIAAVSSQGSTLGFQTTAKRCANCTRHTSKLYLNSTLGSQRDWTGLHKYAPALSRLSPARSRRDVHHWSAKRPDDDNELSRQRPPLVLQISAPHRRGGTLCTFPGKPSTLDQGRLRADADKGPTFRPKGTVDPSNQAQHVRTLEAQTLTAITNNRNLPET